MRFLKIFIITLLLNIVFYTPADKFAWPIPEFKSISSSFGEYRDFHLHKGIDIPTHGKTGYAVHAIADGVIYRIGESYKGYGKIIYIKHEQEGIITVYAHLEKFENSKLMLENLYRQESDRKDTRFLHFYLKNPVKVKKGQLIGFSCETGYGYPHLHFEIRDIKNQYVLNPLKFYDLKDTQRPEIKKIILEPLNYHSSVDGSATKKEYVPKQIKEGFYLIPQEIEYFPGTTARLSVDVFDRFAKDSHNKLSIYSIQIFQGFSKVYEHEFDKLPLNDFMYSEKIYNYQNTSIGPTYYSYRGYDPTSEYGQFRLVGNKTSMKIVVKDYYGNASIVVMTFKGNRDLINFQQQPPDIKKDLKVDVSTIYLQDHFVLALKPSIPLKESPYAISSIDENRKYYGSLFRKSFHIAIPYSVFPDYNIFMKDFINREYKTSRKINATNTQGKTKFKEFTLSSKMKKYIGLSTQINRDLKARSEILTIYPENTFFTNNINLTLDLEDTNKTSLYRRDPIKGVWKRLSTKKKDKNISSNIWHAGSFAALKDIEAPTVQVERYPDYIAATFKDDLSGLNPDSLRIYLYGKKILYDYDIDRNRAFANVPEGDIELEIYIDDYENNTLYKKLNFSK